LRRLKDIVYFDTSSDEFNTRFYGINFSEFLKVSPRKFNNILLLNSEYWRGQYNQNTSLYYIKHDQFEKFIEDDEYSVGDFCWIDFEESNELDTLKPQELAELLYLGHKQRQLNISFFQGLNNFYCYCAHDDGWRTKLYCKEIKDIGEIISNTITLNLDYFKRRKIYEINTEVKEELLKLSSGGLLIDFSDLTTDKNLISIPFYVIGKDLNMDDMYNNQEKLKYNSQFRGYLKQKNKEWYLSEKSW
jgi:hypothetical protein